MFANSRYLHISGGTFVAQNQNVASQRGWDILRQNVAFGAFHNSAERYDPPKCHPGTREAVLRKIMEWIKDPENLRFFLWLYGPAGSGKSAIAQTIAEMLHAAGILAASFFFSRTTAGRNNDRLFIPTIAFQLCLLIPETREIVGKTVDEDPSIFSRSLPVQLQELVLNPLNRAMQDEKVMTRLRKHPNVIIIDGLDECGDGKSQRQILDALSAAAHQFNIPISFLIASRPELEIRQAFNSIPLSSLMLGLPLDDTYLPNNDIRTFLISKFNQIKKEHLLGIYLPAIWPSEEDLDTLIHKASGQFIYASVVVKYTESPRHRPEDRLRVILGLSPSLAKDSPFAVLDALYHQILFSAEEPEKVLEILSYIILWVENPLEIGFGLSDDRRRSPLYIEGVLGYQPGDLDILLSDMHAVLNIPRDRTHEISLYHASLGDFLLDPSRSQAFFIDVKKGHTRLARKYIQFTSGRPEASWKFSSVIPALMVHCTESCLTPELSNDLRDIDFLPSILEVDQVNIDKAVQLWDYFLDWMRGEDTSDPTNNLLQIHLHSQDKWLRRQLTVYPTEAQFFLAAAVTFEDFMADDFDRMALICLLEQIIYVEQPNLLKDRQSPHGDSVLAKIYVQHENTSELTRTISNFLLDPLRAGPLFVDWNKYAILAGALAEFLFRVPGRRDLLNAILPPGLFFDRYHLKPTNEEIQQTTLTLLELALPKASAKPRLAKLLRDRALQYPKFESGRREGAALAALEYIKRSEIPFLEHSREHSDDEICVICSEYPLYDGELSRLFGPEPVASLVDDGSNDDNLEDVTQANLKSSLSDITRRSEIITHISHSIGLDSYS